MNSIKSPANTRPPRVPIVVHVEPEVRWALREIGARRRMSVSDMLRVKINQIIAEGAAAAPTGELEREE
jgi:hypothetical protein